MKSVFIITDRCIKDMLCVEACMREAIHPTADEPGHAHAAQLHINPKRCIGCGACIAACLSGAIVEGDDADADSSHVTRINAAWFGA